MGRLINTLAFVSFVFIANAQYVFTGNGAWSDANNWQNSLVPPQNIGTGATITIQGTAITSAIHPVSIGENRGIITITAGGSLALNNYTQFSNLGSVVINGTLTSNTHFEAFPGSSITISGIFNTNNWIGNAGTITVNNGGIINNTGTLDNAGVGFVGPGPLVVNCGGVINNITPGIFYPGNTQLNDCGTINNSSSLSGNLTFNGNLTNSGTIAPGNSPGTITVSVNYTAAPTAIHNFEVAGTASGNYDVLNVGSNVSLNGTLNVSLINGFTPSTDHDLPIITGTINGTFTTVNIPSSYTLIYNTNSVVLRHSSTLPVNFVSVSVRKQNTGQEISWKVEDEQNVLRYEIEKSKDGNHFTNIGLVNADGLNNYSFKDIMPEIKCFYRIKSLDITGTYKYSTISLYNQGKSSVKLYAFPSPAHQKITIQYSSATINSKLYLIGSDGKTIKTILLAAGTQQTEIDVSLLKAGIYIIRLQNGREQEQSIQIERL